MGFFFTNIGKYSALGKMYCLSSVLGKLDVLRNISLTLCLFLFKILNFYHKGQA